MKLHQRRIAFLLVLVMAAALLCVPSLAADRTAPNAFGIRTYVALGDSVATGLNDNNGTNQDAYGIFVFYIISQIVGVQLIASAVQNSPPTEAIFTGSSVEMLQFIRGVLWRSTAISAVGAAAFYAITHWMLARRLNLQ